MLEVDPTIFQLSNGIRVVYARREAFVAHLGVMIHAGSRFEHHDEQGLAHFIEHCIFKGTNNRQAIDILSDLDSVGGELNAYTNKEEICFHASFRKNHFEIASGLLADIVQFPTFPKEEIEKEKEVVLDEIISYMDNPLERIHDEFEEHLFKGNSLGFNTLGTKESVRGFSQTDLVKYVKRLFQPERMVISFVGDIPLDELRENLEMEFGGLQSREGEEVVSNGIHPEVFNLREKKSNFQTHTLIGGVAPSYQDESRRAMALLTNILGGPALNARLSLKIREEYGYAYNIEAGYTSYVDTGFWSIYMGTDKKYLSRALNLIYLELESIRNQGLSQDELIQGKEQLKGHLALSLDSNLELMFSLAKSMLIFNKIDSIREIYSQIDLISSQEIQSIAQEYFNPKSMSELVYEF